ncbi:hypothetical protein BIU88_01525 [Chlorobaculum limnaeum]|uniref:PIN domain-containing protein n=1 Tax=Chlorobaculum limnaeum TaxID=274537 RepID=A0A1D8CVP4_CHLLM|nr:PIN domain-containing protein [Chlorobaculum limnaeum]AOS82940.1 hypothetical protein BIU88_01525 [Chlorobaculum limnaeum]
MSKNVKRFVWDTSAIINIKDPNIKGYSPAYSLMKDLSDGWISGPYQYIFPSIAIFEVSASVSRMHREGKSILQEFYLMDENALIYDVDKSLIQKSRELYTKPGFDRLRGADLIIACIAAIENAYLITLDKAFKQNISDSVNVIDLNESKQSAKYRDIFGN